MYYLLTQMFAEVIVDISHSEVDKVFEYSFDENCPVKLGSRVGVPFGKKCIEGIVIGIKNDSVYPKEKIKPVYSVLEEIPALTEETLNLAKYVSETCFVSKALALRLFLPSEMRKGRIKELFKRYISLNDGINVEEELIKLKKTAVKQKELLLYLFEGQKEGSSILTEKFGQSALKGLIDKGIVKVEFEKVFRSPYKQVNSEKKKIVLTDAQNDAINSVIKSDKTISLIHGVTGSGKTEIYLELIDKTLINGKTAIMLVPEISLTPQMLSQLRTRFGENAAILHSGLSAGERFDEWWRLRTGDAKIAIGARSAIFAPLEDVGVIIIDEEHDGSYLSESSPRYNTIDIAKERANYSGAKIVLGSATPSVESYRKASIGEYNLITLKERINKKPMPTIEVVDMKKEIRRGNNTPFSSALKAELEQCLKSGNQAIIFLNQRGYSRSVICAECGHVQKCESCDVSLTYHREDESLLCHYCGAKYKMISACTECGSPYIRYGGVGTERVVSELNKIFPEARILRMDRDTTQSKEGHFKILSEFSDGKANILVGTQMIAKGHDFPLVTLVGILDADMSLHFSDFRSGERTFQLITQVAGRSGRADKSGKVILQTYSPEHPVLNMAINYDYNGFFNHEISVRKATGFPPFTDIVRVMISGEDEEETVSATRAIFEELTLEYQKDREIYRFFGCMKAPLKKLLGKYRFQVLMRIDENRKDVLSKIFYVINKYNSRKISAYLEINPNNLS